MRLFYLLKAIIWTTITTVFLFYGSASADNVPICGGVVHYDPLGPAGWFSVPPGGFILPAGTDNVNQPTQPWHWNIELRNPPGGGAINIPIQITVPGAPPTTYKGWINNLPAGNSVIFALHFNESAFLGGDVGGPFAVSVTGGAGAPQFHCGVAVTEYPIDADQIPQLFTSDPEVPNPYNITLQNQSPIPTLSEWGMIIFFVLLLGSVVCIMRRRRMSESV